MQYSNMQGAVSNSVNYVTSLLEIPQKHFKAPYLNTAIMQLIPTRLSNYVSDAFSNDFSLSLLHLHLTVYIDVNLS